MIAAIALLLAAGQRIVLETLDPAMLGASFESAWWTYRLVVSGEACPMILRSRESSAPGAAIYSRPKL